MSWLKLENVSVAHRRNSVTCFLLCHFIPLWVIWIRLEPWLTSALSFIVSSVSSELDGLDFQELQILIPISVAGGKRCGAMPSY